MKPLEYISDRLMSLFTAARVFPHSSFIICLSYVTGGQARSPLKFSISSTPIPSLLVSRCIPICDVTLILIHLVSRIPGKVEPFHSYT